MAPECGTVPTQAGGCVDACSSVHSHMLGLDLIPSFQRSGSSSGMAWEVAMRRRRLCVLVLLAAGLMVLPSCGGGAGGTDPGDGDVEKKCGDCHGVPPSTGAHLAHYGEQLSTPRALYGDLRITEDFEPSGSPKYLFGCGQCHPLDPALHQDGEVQVELHSAAAPLANLKSNNPPTASFDGTGCGNVFCHSSGQEDPSYVSTPAWNGGSLPQPTCGACHENPPRYPSGGAGTPTANTHLVMGDDGFEFGHFGGLPGAWHTSYHGTTLTPDYAAPITCQTCHYESVDPTNTGPGGFYYLDTSGTYDLGGSLGYACGTCHDGSAGAPAQGMGRASPLRHVNGRRDVHFDPRTSIPVAVTGLPAAPDRPTFPYWVSSRPTPLPPDSQADGATWSLHLAAAIYDPVAKSCSNVACHLRQSFGTGIPAFDPLQWGVVPVGNATCGACHQF